MMQRRSHFHLSCDLEVFNGSIFLPTSLLGICRAATPLFTIPFSTPFAVSATQNLLVEIRQTGNSSGNQSFSYPLDAVSGNNTTTRLYGTGKTGRNRRCPRSGQAPSPRLTPLPA